MKTNTTARAKRVLHLYWKLSHDGYRMTVCRRLHWVDAPGAGIVRRIDMTETPAEVTCSFCLRDMKGA